MKIKEPKEIDEPREDPQNILDQYWFSKKTGMGYKDALKKAEEIGKTLECPAFSVRKRARIIAVQHMDGSYLEFHSACCKKLDKEWYAVFTEHHGYHVYHYEDIQWIKEWFKLEYSYLYYSKDI